jgi:hypothetical protein
LLILSWSSRRTSTSSPTASSSSLVNWTSHPSAHKLIEYQGSVVIIAVTMRRLSILIPSCRTLYCCQLLFLVVLFGGAAMTAQMPEHGFRAQTNHSM